MRKFTHFIETSLSALVSYPRTERNGILVITVITTLILGGVVFLPSPKTDPAYLAQADRLNDSLRADFYKRNYAAAKISLEVNSGISTAGLSDRRQTGKQAVYIELNSADSIKLCTVRGIGPVISKNIVQYRTKLGGFIDKNQLKEVWGITDENFEAISAQFFIDHAAIQKIDINFAPANSLRSHPYFTGSMVNRITEARKLKGGWNQLRELVDNDILLPDEAEKVAPYVVFTAR